MTAVSKFGISPPETSGHALHERIRDKSLRVGIVGMGYVGIPLMLAVTQKQMRVVGFDADDEKVHALNAGQSYIRHIASTSIEAALRAGLFSASVSYARATECDVVLLCVPTPLNSNREPDVSFVQAAAASLQPHLRHGQLIILESTTYPGTTEELLRSEFEFAVFYNRKRLHSALDYVPPEEYEATHAGDLLAA